MARLKKGYGTLRKRRKHYFYENVAMGIKEHSLGVTERKEAEKIVKEKFVPLIESKSQAVFAAHIAEARGFSRQKHIEVDDAWKAYEQSPHRPRGSDGTLSNYNDNWRKFAAWLDDRHPEIEGLEQIDEVIAGEFSAHIRGTLAAKTFNDHILRLGKICEVIFRDQDEYKNPWRKIPRENVEHESRREMSEAELSKVLNLVGDTSFICKDREEMEILFHVGAWTGLRLKDAVLLTWDSIDLARGMISVIPYKTRAKTQKRVNIPIHPTLREKLRIASGWRENEFVLPKLAMRYEEHNGGFKHSVTRVFAESGLVTTADRAKGKNKINRYGFSSFRHTFVSFCAKAGVPLPVVQSIVGHSSTAVTRFYIHIGEDSVRQAITALPGGSS